MVIHWLGGDIVPSLVPNGNVESDIVKASRMCRKVLEGLSGEF